VTDTWDVAISISSIPERGHITLVYVVIKNCIYSHEHSAFLN
jgi:hypothetical protein